MMGSSKAVNTACLAISDPITNIALSRQPESVKKCHMGVYGPVYGPLRLTYVGIYIEYSSGASMHKPINWTI
jgi:hypothetical protein